MSYSTINKTAGTYRLQVSRRTGMGQPVVGRTPSKEVQGMIRHGIDPGFKTRIRRSANCAILTGRTD